MTTREQKARIFAKYLGSKMILPKSGRIETLIGVNMEPLELNDGGSFMTYDYFPFKLILKDLSDISDEHAIEVSRMGGYDVDEAYAISDGKGIIKSLFPKYFTYYKSTFNDPEVAKDIIDFLRSQGYNLGDVPQDMYINAKEVSNG